MSTERPTAVWSPASPARRAQEGQGAAAPVLTLAEHLDELRRRLGLVLAVWVGATGLAFAQAERIIEWLRRPAEPFVMRFAFFTPTEPLTAYINVAVLAGLILTMPVLLWQVWAFVRSGLTGRERASGAAFIWWGTVQFLLGAAFAYAVLLPASLHVLLGIGRFTLEPVISISRYLGFVTALVFWCGLIFELPVLVLLLARIGIVTPAWLRQQRPYAVLVLVIVAAIVTPTTDPVSLLLMAAPLVALYEVSILIATFVVVKR